MTAKIGACEGVRVLDLARFQGALPSMIMADYGADVVKVEPPGGEPGRALPGFLQWNRGKRSVVADLRDDTDRHDVRRLAEQADVLIENFRPGVAQRFGLTWESVAAANPGLVHLSMTGFLPDGPYAGVKGYEGIVAAKCGQFVIQNGYRDDGPIYDAVEKCSFGAAMLGLVGVLAALRARGENGRGQQVRSSLFQSNFVYSYGGILGETPDLTASIQGSIQGRDPHNTMPGYRIAQCSDGKWIQSGSATGRIFENFLRALGIDEYFDDPRFENGLIGAPKEDVRYLIGLIDAAYRTRPLDEWCRVLEEHDAAYGLFATTQEFMDHPQIVHNNDVVEVEDPKIGRMRQIGPIARFVGQEWQVPGPAPDPGEHQGLAADGWPGGRLEPSVPGGASLARGALDGVTILDLSMFAAAPGGPGLMADLGARVIKIEPPAGDPLAAGPMGGGELVFRVNRGKERIAVDLKTEEGKAIVHALTAQADVVVHNFRPGVPERIGVDFATLKAHKKDLVYIYAASFGSSGPFSPRPAFDAVISAMAGGEVLQAGEGNPPQQRQTTDHSAILGLAAAILLGLRARDLTGEAQHIETAMVTSAAYLFSGEFIRYEGKPPQRLPDSGQHGLHACYRLYRTAEDGWVFLACPQESEWRRLCDALGRSELADDPRFASPDDRRANDTELAGLVGKVMAQRPAEEWERDLLARDVACVVATGTWPEFLFGNEWHAAADMVTEWDWAPAGKVRQAGANVILEGTPVQLRSFEALGASTRTVLCQLGYADDAIDRLVEEGVVVDPSQSALAG